MRITGCLIILLLASSLALASQESQVKEANTLFEKQQWDEAIDHYLNALEQKKNADIVQYDLGTAFYKKGNYDQSIEHLQKSVLDKNRNLSARSYYNLGNALYKKGRSLEKNKIDEAISSLQKSIESYDQTLHLNPKDQDARYNHKFVEQELERLKKKKEQQQHQQSQSNPSQQKQKDNQSSQNNQNNQNPSQHGSEQKKKDESASEDQNKQPQPSENKENQNPSEQRDSSRQSRSNETRRNLEQQQAKEMLEDYERQEAHKGLLNFADRHQGERHVDKDW